MKKSELRQMIKEEISKLHEAARSPEDIAQDLKVAIEKNQVNTAVLANMLLAKLHPSHGATRALQQLVNDPFSKANAQKVIGILKKNGLVK